MNELILLPFIKNEDGIVGNSLNPLSAVILMSNSEKNLHNHSLGKKLYFSSGYVHGLLD